MKSATWQQIRSLRAAPTGHADSDDMRKRTFSSALRQAEELAHAADLVGYATKPLPLFYMLSQAGRAITAAHMDDEWELHGHGISVRETAPSMFNTLVIPTRSNRDSFKGVARAVGSPTLSGPARLSELWAANPDLLHISPPRIVGGLPLALEVPLATPNFKGIMAKHGKRPDEVEITTQGTVSTNVRVPGQTGAEVMEALQPYPTLRHVRTTKQGDIGAIIANPEDSAVRTSIEHGDLVNVGVKTGQTINMAEYWRLQREFVSIVEVDRAYPTHPVPVLHGYALPEIGGGSAPHPIMLWWALLLGLSSLVRYEPAAWIAAIDLDVSEIAVSIEELLDTARVRVPERILNCLKNGREDWVEEI